MNDKETNTYDNDLQATMGLLSLPEVWSRKKCLIRNYIFARLTLVM